MHSLGKTYDYLNIFMSSDRELAQWKQLVSEAIEGTVDIDRSIDKNIKLYGREAAQFELPKDYPEIKNSSRSIGCTRQLYQTVNRQHRRSSCIELVEQGQEQQPSGYQQAAGHIGQSCQS